MTSYLMCMKPYKIYIETGLIARILIWPLVVDKNTDHGYIYPYGYEGQNIQCVFVRARYPLGSDLYEQLLCPSPGIINLDDHCRFSPLLKVSSS
jgi:hypothetical protein